MQASVSPVMSISQLLSSDTTSNERPIYSPVENNSPVNTNIVYNGAPIQGTHFDPIHRRNNGIQNLLNNDEVYQMDDSDTDTEDIPLIRSPKIEQVKEESDSSMDDDDSDLEINTKVSAAKRARDELSFTDGSDDDDQVLLTYKDEMIQFMINVHKRKRRVIDEYEKKEAVSSTCLYKYLFTNTIV
jgi:DNA helicase INO80